MPNPKFMCQHLKNYYSKMILKFLCKSINEIDIQGKILDVGCGQARNLRLFKIIGFNEEKLFGVDKQTPNSDGLNFCFRKCDVEEGIPFANLEYEVVLCNFVLMFIEPNKQSFVVTELMRVTKKYLIIETNKKSHKKENSFFKEYDFKLIIQWIEACSEFEILQKSVSKEYLIARRRDDNGNS